MANKISTVPKRRIRIIPARKHKMRAQGGLCYYCGQPMWTKRPDVFCLTFGVPPEQARLFRCTAEHLVARCNGGPDHAGNIVAACLHCNQGRHRFKEPLDPPAYKEHIRGRLMSGTWPRLPAPG